MTPLHKAALAVLGLTLAMAALLSWRLFGVRGEVAELKISTAGRQARLVENRKFVERAPKTAKPAALDRSQAVSRLRGAFADLAKRNGFGVQEFQAATDELPYLTAYASDNKDPGWMQVPVRATLQGRATVLMAAIASLRKLDVPFEIDSIEMTRRSTDNKGMSTVSAGIGMRVLIYRGEG